MPIEMSEMPAAVAAALTTGLPRFSVAASPPAENVAAALVARPSLSRGGKTIARSVEAALAQGSTAGVGAPVVVMGLKELSEGQSPRKATAGLWVQWLPAVERGKRAMAEVDQRTGRLTAVIEGAEVKSLARRVESLGSERKPTAARQVLSVIRVPALHLNAVWLQGESASGSDDVVIPDDGPIAPLVPGQRYSLAEFQKVIKGMAAERLANTRGDMGG
jgi:hypothetical protein